MLKNDFPRAQKDDFYVLLAGASGLVGSQVLKTLLNQCHLGGVYTLNRRPLPHQHPRLVQIVDSHLSAIPDYIKGHVRYGVIALGTTLKQAGSKDALKKVDVDLVVDIAKQMQSMGVTHLAVVSSYGANPKSHSHYLCCKGVMEHKLMNIGFEHLVILRPGPLKGEREQPRSNELWLQKSMKILQHFFIGNLKNFVPIDAQDVAQALLKTLLAPHSSSVSILNSIDMKKLLRKCDE